MDIRSLSRQNHQRTSTPVSKTTMEEVENMNYKEAKKMREKRIEGREHWSILDWMSLRFHPSTSCTCCTGVKQKGLK